ncbi:WD repeat-containing protein on Y chromosome-like [Clinocottus analis]|uniref:WD repeat-containing protein on Y chromosome-like n=1 Tax=Clinocottus analis TaxID=304258 RepID=UPI0035C26F2A
MLRHTDTMEDLPEEAIMDPKSKNEKKKFTAAHIPEIEEFFRQADTDEGGGLDIEEFCRGLKEVFGTEDDEELTALFYQIDTNCDGTVDLCELSTFLMNQMQASEGLYDKSIFPKPFKVTTTDHYKAIVDVVFRPYEEEDVAADPIGKPRTYRKGQYISLSSDGILTIWSDGFDKKSRIPLFEKETALPFSHHKKMHVNGMAYINDLKQLAVATSERELLFYTCNEFSELLSISHALIVEDNIISAIHYGSKGTKAVLSFGDVQGYLYVLTFDNMSEKRDLFDKDAYDKISLRDYPTLCVSNLLKNTYQDFQCVKIPIFNDICSKIQYFPSIESLVICGSSSKTMVLVTLVTTHGDKFQKTVFESPADKEFFTCVEYSPLSGLLVTGGTDGLVRAWFPESTMTCKQSFEGHVKPITHISHNPKDKVIVTLSEDKNVCVWSEDKMQLLQKIQVKDINNGPITSMCYNTYNNELVLANTEIGINLGRGTDVFQNALTSHDKPLCCALYHSIYKQVVSVCQDGVVSVWDIQTGAGLVKFKLTEDKQVGHYAVTFDGPQRRLITVSPDGKLRLWNFSSGALLDVHPFTLPKDVVGIVCFDGRVFVSARNSKVIYDLDIVGIDNRFLEHKYLDDISSMDVHENTLITASSNGNIVIWDANSGDVRSWINGSKSPRVVMAMKQDQGRTGRLSAGKDQSTTLSDEKKERKRTSVKAQPLLLCLKDREVKPDVATLLTSTDGYIYAWSVNLKGGLLAKFKAVDEEGAVITTMSTDVREEILITGDSTGKICQWDIGRFGFGKQAKGPFEVTNGWHVSLAQPPQLGLGQCHLSEVVSVEFDHSGQKVISAGLDYQLRLWTNTGSHIGLFGKDVWDGTTKNQNLNLEKTDDQDEAANSALELPLVHSPESVKGFLPETPKLNWEEKLENLDDFLMTKKQFEASCRKPLNRKTVSANDFIKNMENKRIQNPDIYKTPAPTGSLSDMYTPRSNFLKWLYKKPPRGPYEGEERSERALKLRSQDQTPTLDCTNVHLPPISEKVQLTNSPTINQARSKYGRVFKKQQGDTLQDSVLTPCPPSDPKPLKAAYTPIKLPPNRYMHPAPYTSKCVCIPFKQEREKMIQQTQLKTQDTTQDNILAPCPLRYLNPLKVIRGSADLKQSLSARPIEPQLIRGGAEMPKRSLKKIGCILRMQQRDSSILQDSVLAPHPPRTPRPLNGLPAIKTHAY